MIGFLVWFILFIVLLGAVLVVSYWLELIRRKDEYTRDELVNFPRIFSEQSSRLMQPGEEAPAFIMLGAGVLFSWILTLFGGLVSPDLTPAPDYAAAQIPNYFFQSILFPAILHFIRPSLRDLVAPYESGFLGRLMDAELNFFLGLAVSLGAINISLWGVYNEMSFPFCFINMAACLVYAGYRVKSGRDDFDAGSTGNPPADENYDSTIPADSLDDLGDLPDPGDLPEPGNLNEY